jgi:hypothetical protein
MKGRWIIISVLALFLLLVLAVGLGQAQGPTPPYVPPVNEGETGEVGAQGTPMGTAFTYQGQLIKSGTPITDTCDFQFGLYDAATVGNQVGLTQTRSVTATNGLFTVNDLDFASGAYSGFNGDARWLAITVRCPAGSRNYASLDPRQKLTPAPYALALPGLWTQQNATSPNLIGGYSGNSVAGGVHGATIGGGGSSGGTNQVNGNYGTVGGGRGNQASSSYTTVGGGYYNSASGSMATVGGGSFNQASATNPTVGGGWSNAASGDYATIGGGVLNQASYPYATVGGGYNNQASSDYATVGGGYYNQASAISATVGGGQSNQASGGAATVGGGYYNQASFWYATVGGGESNKATDEYATVGGGANNQATNHNATVGGGWGNQATGEYATIPGGSSNLAHGNYSFAAGRRARANHQGAFVWGDLTAADINSSANNQFIVRATGGIYLISTTTNFTPTIVPNAFISTTTGAYLSTGGEWTNGSDRNAKANFVPVDGRDILSRLMGMPMQTWNYKAEDPSICHIGPMAQDFYAAFKVGKNDGTIGTVDADGVALAAIQGLYQLSQEQKAENAALRKEVGELKAENVTLRQRLDDLEARLAALEAGAK